MAYTREDIISILEGYQELKREALQLEFELEHFQVAGEDIIDTMTFNSQLGKVVSGGGKEATKPLLHLNCIKKKPTE